MGHVRNLHQISFPRDVATQDSGRMLDTHPLGCLGPEPVLPRRGVSGVARVLGGIAVLDEAQQGARLVGFEGREVGADEDGLVLEGGSQAGVVGRARASAEGEEEGDGVVQTAVGIVVHCAGRAWARSRLGLPNSARS